MHLAFLLVCLVAVVVAVTGLSGRLQLPAPLVLIAVGIAASYLPFVPQMRLSPEVVLVGLLPPLLYAAANGSSLVDFRTNVRPILLLSVGLVVVTAVGVGLVVHGLEPAIGWSGSFAIGAVVAPPDAVAASAIGRRIGLPRRLVTILEGESLLNDATALVALQTAIAATVSLPLVGLHFVIAAGGGLVIGVAVYVVVGFVRKHVSDVLIDSSLGFITPFAAYVAAEELHASGFLAVVVAGLLLGHKAPLIQSAQERLAERRNWRTISFLLESAVFLLIGLQGRRIISGSANSGMSRPEVLGLCAAVLGAVVVLRLAWVLGARSLLALQRRDPGEPEPEAQAETRVPTWRSSTVLGWAGMRGVVTLAAAFVIPATVPDRDALLLVAFAVTAGTLFVQGLSLPWLARVLRLPRPDRTADALAAAALLHQASQAGLAVLDGLDEDDPLEVTETLRARVEQRSLSAWERVGAGGDETPSEIYARRRKAMIDAERRTVLDVRDTGTVGADVVARVLAMLDVEESMLDGKMASRDRDRSEGRSQATAGGCEDLRRDWPATEPDQPGVCKACVAEGTAWVHLRKCLACGNVGCCDSSPRRHATAHFHEAGHPVMQSAEPGEDWRWCFVHELTG